MLGDDWSCAAKVLEHLEARFAGLYGSGLLRVRVSPRDGLARLQAIGAMGAATAVRWRQHVRMNAARQLDVRRAFAWRVRRAVWNLVKDRVRVSLVAFA